MLTPVVVPQTERLYQSYLKTLDRWFKLQERREKHPQRSIKEDLETCLTIHQELLACAEEVRYPTTLHLMAMLKASCAHPDQSWQDVWQEYLFQQLTATPPSPYAFYQEIVLLWAGLFPQEHNLKRVAQLLSTHFTQSKQPYNRYTKRFLATLSNDLRDLRILGDLRDWRN